MGIKYTAWKAGCGLGPILWTNLCSKVLSFQTNQDLLIQNQTMFGPTVNACSSL